MSTQLDKKQLSMQKAYETIRKSRTGTKVESIKYKSKPTEKEKFKTETNKVGVSSITMLNARRYQVHNWESIQVATYFGGDAS